MPLVRTIANAMTVRRIPGHLRQKKEAASSSGPDDVSSRALPSVLIFRANLLLGNAKAGGSPKPQDY
jgi:hypothetical protein